MRTKGAITIGTSLVLVVLWPLVDRPLGFDAFPNNKLLPGGQRLDYEQSRKAVAESAAAIRTEYRQIYAEHPTHMRTSITPEEISTSVDLWAVAQHLKYKPAAGAAPEAPGVAAKKSKKAQAIHPGAAAVLAARRLKAFTLEDPRNLEQAVAMLLSGTLPSLVKQLNNLHVCHDQATVQDYAVIALYELSGIEGTACAVIAATPGCIEALGQVISTSPFPEVRSVAALTLGNLADEFGGRMLIGDSPGVVPSLVALLNSNRTASQEAAAFALRNLAINKVNAQVIARIPGTVDRLVRLLGDTSSDLLQQRAAALLAHLAAHRQVHVGVRSTVALLRLQLKGSTSPEAAAAARLALRNLAPAAYSKLLAVVGGGLACWWLAGLTQVAQVTDN